MEAINLIDSFAEFKELKNIDRATLMRVLEDIFRNMLIKRYGTDENFDIIINRVTWKFGETVSWWKTTPSKTRIPKFP